MTHQKDATETKTQDEAPAQEIVKAEAPPALATLEAGASLAAIIPRNPDEAWRLSVSMYEAGMVPESYSKNCDPRKTKARVMVGIMKGMEIGLPPVTALSTILIINNRPCVWGDGALAIVQASGLLENSKEWIEGDSNTAEWTAHCEMKRKDQETPILRSFSWAQAQKAKLTTKAGPWNLYPERMLQMRARAYALRDGFADALNGLSIGEEIRDIPVVHGEVSTDFLADEKPALPKPDDGPENFQSAAELDLTPGEPAESI